jgi:hypothetical protein
MEEVHENQVKEILPYQFEPEIELISHSSDSEEDSSSSDESIDEEFELANSWRNSTLSWCKCDHCKIMPKTIENFYCKERAVEYDEYDEKLSQAESSGDACITQLPDFQQNMLTESVLKIDACRYVEENRPLGDDEMAKTHKIFRLVSYYRCSRWIFEYLGKKNRRPFSACIYTAIRERFSSPDGLYTGFKYPKTINMLVKISALFLFLLMLVTAYTTFIINSKYFRREKSYFYRRSYLY